MIPAEIEEELIDIKRELDRREMRGAPTRENNALRERVAAIEKHLSIQKQSPTSFNSFGNAIDALDNEPLYMGAYFNGERPVPGSARRERRRS
jgi:hypothetical protein